LFSVNQLTIKSKLSLIMVIVMLGLLSLSVLALVFEKNLLLKDREVKTQHLVDVAYGIMAYQYDLQSKGSLTEEQAKAAAIATIKSLKYDEKEYFWINDMTPSVVMHPTKPELDGKDASGIKDPNGKALFVEFVNAVKKDGAGFVSYLWPKPGYTEPVPKISYVKGFKPWGWIVGSGIYIDDVDAIFWTSAKWLLLACAVLTIFIYAILRLIIRSITSPLLSIRDTIKSLRDSKDLSSRIKLSNRDEIGEIAESFNEMVGDFQKIIHQVADGVHEVRKSSEHLHEASQRVEQGSKLQNDSAASMAAATEEMLTSIELVADNSKQTSEIADKSMHISSSGEATVIEAASEMTRIAQAVNDSSASINQLGEESKEISNIVNTIKEIADQTNLLALNAAIEAARAGEQGRGFAVVADEVRKLAERTTVSTLEIGKMIEKIQAETVAAVHSMSEGTERVSEGVEKAHQAGLSMSNIREGAQNVLVAVNEITTALEEQKSVGRQVARDVEHIAQMAEQNYAAVNDVAQTIERLTLLADSLQHSVDQFRA
jgi:methyl-accepting chemotaxis protein